MDEGSQSLKTTSTKRNAKSFFYPFISAQQRKVDRAEEKAVGFSFMLILAEQFLLYDRKKKKRLNHCRFVMHRNKKSVRNK